MAGLLTGLLGALGGPQNILKSVGGFVGDIIEGVEQHKPFGKTLLSAAGRGLKSLVGLNGEQESLNNRRNMIVPRDMLGRSRQSMDREAMFKQQRVLQDQATPGGLPVVRTLRLPEEKFIKKQIVRRPQLDREVQQIQQTIEDDMEDRRTRRMKENLPHASRAKRKQAGRFRQRQLLDDEEDFRKAVRLAEGRSEKPRRRRRKQKIPQRKFRREL